MADIAVTDANVRIIESIEARLIPMVASVAITRGTAVYRTTAGLAAPARANAVATAKVVGIATTTAAAGTTFEALYHGRLAGYTLGDPGSTVHLSVATAGKLADARATDQNNVVVPIGTVHTMTDGTSTKYLFVDIPQNADPVGLP